jgi:hypothetical protein
MNKLIFTALGVVWCSTAFAGVTFQTSEVDVGQGVPGLHGVFTNQWSAFNVLGDGNSIVYNDSHDTFDGVGITYFQNAASAVTFISPVNVLTVDYLVLAGFTINLTALDAGSNVLGTFSDTEGANFNGTHVFDVFGIQQLIYSSDSAAQTGISDLAWQSQSPAIPEPVSLLLIGGGLCALALLRGRTISSAVWNERDRKACRDPNP